VRDGLLSPQHTPAPLPRPRPPLAQIGVPFSDPMADGSVIQRSNQIALEGGYTLGDCIAAVKEARAGGLTIPVVFMGYYNPFMQYGDERLVADCVAAGVDGFIIVDLPPEDAGAFIDVCDKGGLAFVPLIAPTTSMDRFEKVAARARGFVYCVSVMGVTGARRALPKELPDFLAAVKARVSVPVAVGFGVSSREQVDEVGRLADGVVMGSAVVTSLERDGVPGLRAFLQEVVPKPAVAK
jgi:tryptophan synthase alpha subunit